VCELNNVTAILKAKYYIIKEKHCIIHTFSIQNTGVLLGKRVQVVVRNDMRCAVVIFVIVKTSF